MVNTTYNSTEDMINKLKFLKGKTMLEFYKIIFNYYDENINRNFQFEEDPFSKIVQGFTKIYHEVLLFRKFLQTKPQDKNMIIIYYDLYYTVIKNTDEKENVDNQYEIDYIIFNDIIPNHYIGRNNI